jgi:hypothetical protein
MEVETPAEGIMRFYNWGKTKSYRVACECGSLDHTHDVWVEADDTNITVTTYTTQKTRWWQFNRFELIWTLLTRGYIEYEANIIMSKQQALNYAKTIERAIIDVETFKNERKKQDA